MYIQTNFIDKDQNIPQPFTLDRYKNLKIRHRDKLISTLLQDRGALRLISAPHGFGKSVLAYEYALRLFHASPTIWLDASMPEFLQNLDKGQIIPIEFQSKHPVLVIIDDIPYLDEKRAETLANHIDLLLYKGSEVIVTTIPSNDCLRSRLPDRILVSSRDLLIDEKEYTVSIQNNTSQKDVKASWEQQAKQLFGLTPSLLWQDKESALQECLNGFFTENLPLDFLRSIFCMLLMGKGSEKDLERLGVPLRAENETMLLKDYPFINFEPIQHNFQCAFFPLENLQIAIEHAGLTGSLVNGILSLPEKVLGVLLSRKNNERATNILQMFCSDERCALWLAEQGWVLLDRGELSLIEALFSRCPQQDLETNNNLIALRAWTSGIQGDKNEATYYAQYVLKRNSSSPDTSSLMSYLALLAFGEGGAAIFQKPTFEPKPLSTPEDYLAAIVDECEENELMRSFCLRPCEQANILNSQRINVSKRRENSIETLLTKGVELFVTSPFIRLSLHFLAYIDSSNLRKVLQDLGYGIVLHARRNAIETNTEALLIQDLWKNGFFGVSGRGNDIQDARLLDSAAHIINRLGILTSSTTLKAAWEEDVSQYQKNVSLSVNNKTDKIPCASVRLFGGFEVTVDDQIIDETRWRKKSRALFILLVLGQGRELPRNFIFNELWPNIERKRALDNFYSVWNNAEKMLGKIPYIERKGEFCRINPQLVSSDVAEFEKLTRRLLTEREDSSTLLDVFAQIESLYRGALTPSELNIEHITAQRSRFSAMYTDAMISAVDYALKIGDSKVALWFARKAMEEDGEREDVFYALIRAQVASGQRCSAIKTFFQCKEFLRENLGLDPSKEVTELYEQLITIDPSLMKLEPASLKR